MLIVYNRKTRTIREERMRGNLTKEVIDLYTEL